MELSRDRANALARRLRQARSDLVVDHPFFGLLAMKLQLRLGDEFDTAWTDGNSVTFNPDFLESLDPGETRFVLMHEVMHDALSHPLRGREYPNHDLFNVAADLVVNSSILEACGDDLEAITLRKWGVSMHLAPNGKEGRDYSVDELYDMLERKAKVGGRGGSSSFPDLAESSADSGSGSVYTKSTGSFDWHLSQGESSSWQDRAQSAGRVMSTVDSLERKRQAGFAAGEVPRQVSRLVDACRRAKLNWKDLLDSFIAQDTRDYSYAPPDTRFADAGWDFVLPGYNPLETPRSTLFLVDTSASVSDEELAAAIGEMRAAVELCEGLTGWVAFFDAEASEPVRFDDVQDLATIEPVGGGGTSFTAAFSALERLFDDQVDVGSVVILTDGYAPFPDQSIARGVPVLWVITNDEESTTPPWGRIARMVL